jgi:hypothetical protein
MDCGSRWRKVQNDLFNIIGIDIVFAGNGQSRVGGRVGGLAARIRLENLLNVIFLTQVFGNPSGRLTLDMPGY